ncbi:MAG: universal stress protein [Pseudomonadota bacterium]
MTIRSIFALYNGQETEASALNAAMDLAEAFGATLTIVHVVFTPPTGGFFGEAITVGTGYQDLVLAESARAAAAARANADAVCSARGVTLGAAGGPVHYREMREPSNAAVVRDLSLCDLIVVCAPKGSGWLVDATISDLTLFLTRRPLLVVRPGPTPNILGAPAGVAWNGSLEAIHALIGGRPLLSHATPVTLYDGAGAADASRAADAYLRAADIFSTTTPITGTGTEAARQVLAAAKGSGLIVMGAYGHSVLRERLFGGFTETMLEEADVPLLLCH